MISEYSGILPYAHVFYVASILNSAEACLVAYSRYGRELEQSDDDGAAAAAALHEALGHAAGLSRFFWSPRGALAAARAKNLRAEFGVGDESPLKDRGLRDALEHFDERLDDFLLGDAVGLMLPHPIIADSRRIDNPTAQVFKLADPWNGVYVLFNHPYVYQPIIDEVSRIYALAYDLYNGTDCSTAGDKPSES